MGTFLSMARNDVVREGLEELAIVDSPKYSGTILVIIRDLLKQ